VIHSAAFVGFPVKYDLKDMAWSVVVLLTIAAITFVILGM
jgi:hypothetical protein